MGEHLTVVQAGYANGTTRLCIDLLLKDDPGWIIVDTRHVRQSSIMLNKRPVWNGEELEKDYDARYKAISELGNVNHKTPWLGVKMVDENAGVKRVFNGLKDKKKIILLCQCLNCQTCHTAKIIKGLEKLAKASGCTLDVLPAEHILEKYGYGVGLSINQPYASYIGASSLLQEKNIPVKEGENREWLPCYRGPLYLHASGPKSFKNEDYQRSLEKFPGLEDLFPNREIFPVGGVLYKADFYDVVLKDSNPWFRGKYYWKFRNVEPASLDASCIPLTGGPGLFPIPLCHCCVSPLPNGKGDVYTSEENGHSYTLCPHCVK